ncbi:MAG: hypothetical protein JSU98_01110 [Gemmatimonadales bacterium]|jgi:hypothetical protein|nr:MAG: hypothetical protein JSU98_01110 [Gemmatimonadales bacterium]
MGSAKESKTSGVTDATKDIFDATTDFMLAMIRGTAKGWGKGLSALGHELEKFGEDLKGSERTEST